jgi:hypothetical protein
MVHVEQYGSNTFHIKNLPEDRALERYEMVELLKDAINQGINPSEFLDRDTIEQYCTNDESELFI